MSLSLQRKDCPKPRTAFRLRLDRQLIAESPMFCYDRDNMEPSASPVPIRVLLADDYTRLYPAIARLLAPVCEIVGSVTNVSHFLSETKRLQPDVVLLDLRLAGTNGLAACRQMRDAVPTAKVVLDSASDEPDLADRALAAGASDFVAKTRVAIDLLPAIQRVAAGR